MTRYNVLKSTTNKNISRNSGVMLIKLNLKASLNEYCITIGNLKWQCNAIFW